MCPKPWQVFFQEWWFSVEFFTRFPCPQQTTPLPSHPVDPARALALVPITGAVLGSLVGFSGWGLAAWFPPAVASWIMVMLYGLAGWTLHLDGWGDLADGWGSGRRGEAMRHIMKDSRMGGFGVFAVVGALGLWTAAVSSLPPQRWPEVLALSGGMGRFGLTVAAFFGTYPWKEGLGKAFVRGFDRGCLFRVLTISASLAFLDPVLWIGALMVTTATGWVLAKKSHTWIGGTSGDILGATAVAGELLVLLLATAQ